jgi:hypothetical protein
MSICAVVLLVVGGFADPAFAGKRPTSGVTIETVQVQGTGCRGETAAVALSPDLTAFTVTYSAYVVQAGPGAKPKDVSKDCKLKVKVSLPKNWTFAIDQIDYRGYGQLAAGVRATFVYETASRVFTGPLDDDWQVTDASPPAFGPCGKQRMLPVETSLTIDATGADPKVSSMFTMDSTDGSIRSVYRLTWQTC